MNKLLINYEQTLNGTKDRIVKTMRSFVLEHFVLCIFSPYGLRDTLHFVLCIFSPYGLRDTSHFVLCMNILL